MPLWSQTLQVTPSDSETRPSPSSIPEVACQISATAIRARMKRSTATMRKTSVTQVPGHVMTSPTTAISDLTTAAIFRTTGTGTNETVPEEPKFIKGWINHGIHLSTQYQPRFLPNQLQQERNRLGSFATPRFHFMDANCP